MAGIVLSNVLPYLEAVYTLPSLWRQNQYDCVSGDALGRLGRMEGKPSERGREQTKVISVSPPSDASLLLLRKRESRLFGAQKY